MNVNRRKSTSGRYAVIVFALLSACGGGDSGDLNPGLSGKLFYQGELNAWTMDMASGSYTKIPNTNWRSQKERFRDHRYGITATPVDYNGSEFLVKADHCSEHSSAGEAFDCIAIQGYDGVYQGKNLYLRYNYYSGFTHFPKMSRNLQYIALFRYFDTASSAGSKYFAIYDRQHKLVSDKAMVARSYDWLPDGRLIYFEGRTLNFTAPYSTEVESQLPPLLDSVKGRPRQIAINPDGTQLAFVMITTTSGLDFVTGAKSAKGTPYIMNIDGTGLRELATTPEEEPVVMFPRWSPDGKLILLSVTHFKGGPFQGGDGSGFSSGTGTHQYLVPSEDMGKTFMMLGPDQSPEVRPLRRFSKVAETSSLSYGSSITTKELGAYWIP